MKRYFSAGLPGLSNDSQVMKADDVKGVIDGWASDLNQSYLKLKKH